MFAAPILGFSDDAFSPYSRSSISGGWSKQFAKQFAACGGDVLAMMQCRGGAAAGAAAGSSEEMEEDPATTRSPTSPTPTTKRPPDDDDRGAAAQSKKRRAAQSKKQRGDGGGGKGSEVHGGPTVRARGRIRRAAAPGTAARCGGRWRRLAAVDGALGRRAGRADTPVAALAAPNPSKPSPQTQEGGKQ